MSSVYFVTFFALGLCLHASGNNFGIYEMKINEESPNESLDYISKISVNLTSSQHVCSDKFLSISIDTYSVFKRWQEFQFGSRKLQNMAAAMSPADLRLGGTLADFVLFDPTAVEEHLIVEHANNTGPERDLSEFEAGFFGQDIGKDLKNFTMTGKMWDNMTTFFSAAGWDLMFDFNLFLWKDHGLWNSSNADLLLNYSAARGYQIPSFQLGNEPNAYHHNYNFSIEPEILLKDFKILKKLISSYPLYKDSGLYGPDVTNLIHPSSKSYLQGFIDAGAADVVEEISLHLWLDQLGVAACYGVKHVFRQSFFGGDHALLSPTLDPNPDYFLSLLYKRLIEGPVFDVSIEPTDSHLRVYANCARRVSYPAGALVLYFLNLKTHPVILSLSQFQGEDLDLYLLTPGDSEKLKSRFVKLNGQKLLMQGSLLPQLLPKPHKGDVTVDGQSFGFVVVPHANVPWCVKYYKQKGEEQ